MTKQESDRFIPTRGSLLRRLKDWEDDASWEEFKSTYERLIYQTALRAGLGDADAQDVRQETLVAVSKAMRHFRYDPRLGSFKGWLLQTTKRKILDHISRVQKKDVASARPRPAELERTATIERVADPASLELQAAWEDDYRKVLYETALAKIRRRVSPKTFQLFDLQMNKQWPVKRIKEAMEVSAADVHLAKFRVMRMIKKEIRRLEREVI